MFPTVATAGVSDDQLTIVETSWVDRSLKVAMAVKSTCPPIGMLADVGASETETTVASVTLNGTETVLLPSVAVTLTDPGATPKPIPELEPIFKIVVSDADQMTRCVMSRMPPSLNVPKAAN